MSRSVPRFVVLQKDYHYCYFSLSVIPNLSCKILQKQGLGFCIDYSNPLIIWHNRYMVTNCFSTQEYCNKTDKRLTMFGKCRHRKWEIEQPTKTPLKLEVMCSRGDKHAPHVFPGDKHAPHVFPGDKHTPMCSRRDKQAPHVFQGG